MGLSPEHVPKDLSALERRVLSLNAKMKGEQIDLLGLLALRCVPESSANELLDTLEGRKGVSKVCNYIQALGGLGEGWVWRPVWPRS